MGTDSRAVPGNYHIPCLLLRHQGSGTLSTIAWPLERREGSIYCTSTNGIKKLACHGNSTTLPFARLGSCLCCRWRQYDWHQQQWHSGEQGHANHGCRGSYDGMPSSFTCDSCTVGLSQAGEIQHGMRLQQYCCIIFVAVCDFVYFINRMGGDERSALSLRW